VNPAFEPMTLLLREGAHPSVRIVARFLEVLG
jgi:hypothetical protein